MPVITDLQMRNEIRKLLAQPTFASSDRLRDKIRRELKRRKLIFFDRESWAWIVTEAGHQFLTTTQDKSS